jgi:nickel/cobalt exporter
MLQIVVDIQREIYLALAEHIKAFAAGGGWAAFLAFLPLGVVFGAVHATTPGHSKSVLATYLTGTSAGAARGLAVSVALSFTHVTMAVLIAWFSLPLVSRMLGSAGDAPALENISRGLLGVIGLWMLWSALFRPTHTHGKGEGLTVGMMSGLIPCPLSLFVMSFAMSRGVPVAGVVFALVMMLGVMLTLSLTALAVILCRQQVTRLLFEGPD